MANITTLRCENGIATKTFKKRHDGLLDVTEFRAGHDFTWRVWEIDDIAMVAEMLGILEHEFKQHVIVRAEVIPAFRNREIITRTLLDIPGKQIAMLQAIPEGTEWAMFDFDEALELPPGMTPAEGVELLIKRLPAEFHDASYAYQLSSSAGVVGTTVPDAKGESKTYHGWKTISVHVFFWFSRPVQDMARWAKNLNAVAIAAGGKRIVDPSTLETVQPNYTAAPHFVDMADPVVAAGYPRSGFVKKTVDAVELVWIEAPVRLVKIKDKEYRIGTLVRRDGVAYIATSSLAERIARIGVGNDYRAPLMSAIGYYFWYHGTDGSPAEIKRLLRAAFPDGIKHYLNDHHLDSMVQWQATIHNHPPTYQDRKDADALADQWVKGRDDHPPLPDADETVTDYEDWIFDLEDYGLQFNYMEGECGIGKTDWLVDEIGNKPDRRVICLPRIDLINEVSGRVENRYPDLEQRKNYHIQTVYTHRDGDIRDPEDEADIHSPSGASVRQQVAKFREKVKGRRHVVLFITHAALLLTDWSDWRGYKLFVDEVPDPYQSYSLDFRNTAEWVKRYIQINGEETNYYRLGLTADGEEKVKAGRFDYNEGPIRSVLESLSLPNTTVFALRTAWDDMANQKVQMMRLTNPGFLRPFAGVTIMGDEFMQSTLALAFTNKYNVEWTPHPDWHPTRMRSVPLKDRVRIFYFASKADRRASITGYADGKLIPKLIKWFDQSENDPGQTLITTNRRFEHHFPKPKFRQYDVATENGIQRSMVQTNEVRRLWVPPKLAGTDVYKDMTNVAWFAAMRPGGDERAFVANALQITEEQQIRWREYNALFQFVMRGCLRKYDSDEICNVYVFDEHEAGYLRDRFGGCLEYTYVPGVVNTPLNPGGRPKMAEGQAKSALDRKQAQRQRDRDALKAARQEKAADSEFARMVQDLKAKLDKPRRLGDVTVTLYT